MKEINGMNNSENQNRSSTKTEDSINYYSISFIVLSFLALVLYIFVILLILWNKKLRRRPANKFILNLVISDGIVCISFMLYAGQVLEIWEDKRSFFENYFMRGYFVVFLDVVIVLSMLNFTLITVDRLIAVKWPLFYVSRIHTKESFIAIAVVWAITIVYAVVMVILFNVLDPETSRYLGNTTFVVIVIAGFMTLFMSNSFGFVEARRHLRRIETISRNIENISAEFSDKSEEEQEKRKRKRERAIRKKEFRLVRINIGLILSFFLFWINLLILYVKILVYDDELEPPISLKYILASWYLGVIYYICNPLWFVALSHDVKREVKKLLRGKLLEESSKR